MARTFLNIEPFDIIMKDIIYIQWVFSLAINVIGNKHVGRGI